MTYFVMNSLPKMLPISLWNLDDMQFLDSVTLWGELFTQNTNFFCKIKTVCNSRIQWPFSGLIIFSKYKFFCKFFLSSSSMKKHFCCQEKFQVCSFFFFPFPHFHNEAGHAEFLPGATFLRAQVMVCCSSDYLDPFHGLPGTPFHRCWNWRW